MKLRAMQSVYAQPLQLLPPPEIALRKIAERIATGSKIASADIDLIGPGGVDCGTYRLDAHLWVEETVQLLNTICSESWPAAAVGTIARSFHPGGIQDLYKMRSLKESVTACVTWLKDFTGRPEFKEQEGAASRQVDEVGAGSVFVVYGHDEKAKDDVMAAIESLGLNPIDLSAPPNRTNTIIEKIEELAPRIAFAVVILTPDDLGAPSVAIGQCGTLPQLREVLGPRARQNVVLELGYFWGRLGRRKVLPLFKGVKIDSLLEEFSDWKSVLCTEMDAAGVWRRTLAEELGAAGFQVDGGKL
jgi:predicted nucleotide-binding protein